MGLISGMVMGILFGIAVMAGWTYMMGHRSNKRVAKAVDIKLLSQLNRDDIKKICGETIPEWISFPVYEQVRVFSSLFSLSLSAFFPLPLSDFHPAMAADDGALSASLLVSGRRPHVVLSVRDEPDLPQSTPAETFEANRDSFFQPGDLDRHNPFAFLGASDGYEVPESSTIDPFRNHTPDVGGLYEWVNIVVCLPLVLSVFCCSGCVCQWGIWRLIWRCGGGRISRTLCPSGGVASCGLTRLCARAILFSFGYHWINKRGKPAPREIAPIVVSNHVSYIDPIFYFYELFPTIVSSESHDSMPFVGTIIRAMQVIYVDRFSRSSRKHAVNEIKDLKTEESFLQSVSSSAFISRGNNKQRPSNYFLSTWCIHSWLSCSASYHPLSPCAL